MRRNKIILSAVVLLAAAGSAFAVKSARFIPANVYTYSGGTYTLIQCATAGADRCTPADVPAPSNFYKYTTGVGYQHLTPGTDLFLPQ